MCRHCNVYWHVLMQNMAVYWGQTSKVQKTFGGDLHDSKN